MSQTKTQVLLLLSLPCLLLLAVLAAGLGQPTLPSGQTYELAINNQVGRTPAATSDPTSTTATHTALWFVGDVMLSRQVGAFAETNGYDYPWRGVTGLFGNDLVLANFEACFSVDKTFTREHSMRFPVNPAMVDWVRTAGVTHVSQANNHGLDCGQADYEYSRSLFIQNDITPIGHPTRISSTSIAYLEVGEYRLGVLAFHTLFAAPTVDQLRTVINDMASSSDLQVVFVHWGDEYQLSAVASQRALAQQLADMGVDIVVGHHPHVVQDIVRLNDTLVVYSLGNFIFDQYFSIPVQEGLVAQLVTSPGLGLTLVPVSTRGTPTQPHVMPETERRAFLTALAERSDETLRSQIMAGQIELSFLATSTKSSIIATPPL